MATIIRVNGTAGDMQSNSSGLSLKVMQTAVDGTIDIVRLLRGDNFEVSLVIDDEGRVKGKSVNKVATAIFQRLTQSPDFICGDAILVAGYDVGLETEAWR